VVRWRGIFRAITPAIVFFAILPALIIYVCLGQFGFTTDSLLAIIIFFQTYIVMLQVEIALRQTAVFEAEYEPALKVDVNTVALAIGGATNVHQNISLKNVGSYLAYNVFVGLVNGTTRKPIVERTESQAPRTLGPGDSLDIISIDEPEYTDMNIEMNVLYVNSLNETRDAKFVKFPKSTEFMILRTPRTRPGILLKSLEDIKLAHTAIKWSRTLRKVKNRSQ